MSGNNGPARRLLLTKSLFKTATTCPRKLRYATNPHLYPRRADTSSLQSSLADEGRKFELYCRARHYGSGVEIGGNRLLGGSSLEFGAGNVNDAVVDELVEQTRSVLFDGAIATDSTTTASAKITIFEGAIRHKNYYVRADVLQYDPDTNTITLIEIKAKSWDSGKAAAKDNPMVGKRGSIKSGFLPYIHDVAFQKMVLQGAYPQCHVEAYLMMPDKSKRTSLNNLNRLVGDLRRGDVSGNDDDSGTAAIHARELIANSDEDLTALVDVTDLVDQAIEDILIFPGCKDETFVAAAEEWAAGLVIPENEDGNTSVDAKPPPIGSHCKTCEYRLNSGEVDAATLSDTNGMSGFATCWKEATGLDPDAFQKGSAVIDLWNGSKKDLNRFIDNGKYRLSDLTNEDLGFTDDGVEMKKTKSTKSSSLKDGTGGMSRSRRQLYQAKGFPMKRSSSSLSEASYLLDAEYLLNEMETWKYPYHFIDFETAAPALPYFAGMTPFDMIAFQFSHHVLHEDGRVEHVSQFLHAEPGHSPNNAFLGALGEAVGDCRGSVFRWGIHENTVLKSLLRNSEDENISKQLQPLLQGGSRAMVDQMKTATLGYFVSGSDGSSSIKRLLSPTLQSSARLEQCYGTPSYSSHNFTDIQWFQRVVEGGHGKVKDPYSILTEYESSLMSTNVTDGGAAIAAYNVLQSNSIIPEERTAIEASLLRYCELDTLAMVMIVQAWQGFLEDVE